MTNKGTKYELELFDKLWDMGFGVIRSPASGGRREEPQPDILANTGMGMVAFECKYSSKKAVYLEKREVEELSNFCERMDSKGCIAVRFSHMDWKLVNLSDLTDCGKTVKVSRRKAKKKGMPLDELTT